MDQINNEKVGSYISELRKAKKLTQKDLADKLYVSDKTVSKWERGVSMPSIPLLMPLANLFDITVTELLKGEHQNIESLKPCDIHASITRYNGIENIGSSHISYASSSFSLKLSCLLWQISRYQTYKAA